MTWVFPHRSDRWAVGDKAYCVRGGHGLVEGRVYVVTKAKHYEGSGFGLQVEGIALPAPHDGFFSTRFIRIEAGQSALKQIDAGRQYSPLHYWRSAA